jgi:hypothetical protein
MDVYDSDVKERTLAILGTLDEKLDKGDYINVNGQQVRNR